MRLKFEIENAGEIGAGIMSYTETVIIEVDSGNPGGEDGEFMDFMQDALTEWFDGSTVMSEDVTYKDD